jgi:hypothetical protein
MLHLALFRTESSARSGARVRARDSWLHVREALELWRQEDSGGLVSWLLAEREKAPARAGRKPAGSDASVDEALKLVAAGELSRAASRLTSSGLADACDPRILGQLRDKHLRGTARSPRSRTSTTPWTSTRSWACSRGGPARVRTCSRTST